MDEVLADIKNMYINPRPLPLSERQRACVKCVCRRVCAEECAQREFVLCAEQSELVLCERHVL